MPGYPTSRNKLLLYTYTVHVCVLTCICIVHERKTLRSRWNLNSTLSKFQSMPYSPTTIELLELQLISLLTHTLEQQACCLILGRSQTALSLQCIQQLSLPCLATGYGRDIFCSCTYVAVSHAVDGSQVQLALTSRGREIVDSTNQQPTINQLYVISQTSTPQPVSPCTTTASTLL